MSTPSFYARISFQAKVLIPVITIMVLLIAVAMWVVNQRFTSQFQPQALERLETANNFFTHSQSTVTGRRFKNYQAVLKEPRVQATFTGTDDQTRTKWLNDEAKEDQEAKVLIYTPNTGTDPQLVGTNGEPGLDAEQFKARSAESARIALNGEPNWEMVRIGDKLYDLLSVPFAFGAMTFAVEIGDEIALEIKQDTGSDIVFLSDGKVVASSLSRAGLHPDLAAKFGQLLADPQAAEMPAAAQLKLDQQHYICKAERFPARKGQSRHGYLLLSSIEKPLGALRETQRMLFLVSLLGILASTAVVWLVINKVTQPLRQLRKSAEAVGRGDFSKRVEVNSRDECGELAGVFNQMTQNLKHSHEELERTLDTLKATQNQLIQSEKLSGIGEFVAGVAHELNNPLTSVMGFSELLQNQPEFPESQRRFMEMIFKSAKRCQKIVQSLLSFARRHAPERKVLCVNEVVESAAEILAYQMRTSNIEVITQLDPCLPATLVDPHQMQQVFLNIINNARQAMEGRQTSGRLCVSTEAGRGCVRIIFRDNGPGIPPENLTKIFNPFFTTKEVGKGTGLGLSLCYGIVTEHGGTITPQSRLGEGATFIIELPITREPAAKPEKIALQPEALSAREGIGKRVLVVDDEDSILQMIRAALTMGGYRVDVARDGETALQRLRECHYDLTLCDWKMPGLNGQQVYERLHTTNPELSRRLIFITGDVVNEKTQEFLKASNKICLSKPFTLAEFRAALSRILSAA